MAARKIKKKELEHFTLPSPEETVTPNIPSLPEVSKEEGFWQTKRGKTWLFLFVVSILLAIIAGLFIYREGVVKSGVNSQNIPVPSPTSAAKPQIFPTPTQAIIDVSKYEIEILNGSGLNGEAAKVKGQLENEKFTVISIGNALLQQKTVIQVKQSVPKEFIAKLKSFLEQTYVLDSIQELDESAKFDAAIIIGSQKAE